MRTLLVTGHAGFVGRTVSRLLTPDSQRWRVATLPDGFDVRSAELTERVAAIRPDAVLHLAGVTNVPESFRDPEHCFDVNFNGTWNLLKALRSSAFAGRMLFVSSGDCYGIVSAEALPIRETQPLRPRSPYAMSKAAAEALCFQWCQTDRLDIVIARSFNHIGCGQDPRFAISSFARQVASIRAGSAPARIETGALDVTRDLTDVRDVVRAYLALLESGATAEVYNVASGRETRISDVLDDLLAIANVTARIVTDPSRVRPAEQRRAVADVHKIAHDTGWTATTPLTQTLSDMLDDWTRRIRLG